MPPHIRSHIIATERLILRPWKDEDFAPFAGMNADPRVREFFPSLQTREESDKAARHFQTTCARDGFGLCAAELTATGQFIGFVGIQTMGFAVPSLSQPAIEIGWRLAHAHWGKGLATEGARAVVQHAFESLKLSEIVAITVPANIRSRRVMEKIGMRYHPELDFDHPRIAEGHPLRRHVLYCIHSVAARGW